MIQEHPNASNFNRIREALARSLLRFQSELNIYHHVPRTLVPPAAIIKPVPQRTVKYLQAQSSFLAEWHFTILLVIGELDEEAAQDMAGAMISPGSELITAINDTPLGKGHWAKVTEASIAEMTFDEGLYTYAELAVTVKA